MMSHNSVQFCAFCGEGRSKYLWTYNKNVLPPYFIHFTFCKFNKCIKHYENYMLNKGSPFPPYAFKKEWR